MSIHNRLQQLSEDRRLCSAKGKGATSDHRPLPLRTVGDVLAVLEEQVEALRADDEASALEKSRAVGYLAGIALRAIETNNLAARIEMLEMVLKQRHKDAKP